MSAGAEPTNTGWNGGLLRTGVSLPLQERGI